MWAIASLTVLAAYVYFYFASPFLPLLIVLGKAETMRNLSSAETMASLRNMFDRNYNFTELYEWEHQKIRFATNETFERSSDPLRILQIGKGRCGEFAVLYVALCVAHGYQSRLVMSVDVNYRVFWFPQHEWAEVKLNGEWIHVDPSDQVWNAPSHYKTWSWADGIGSSVRIYAFENGKTMDITEYYEMANQENASS